MNHLIPLPFDPATVVDHPEAARLCELHQAATRAQDAHRQVRDEHEQARAAVTRCSEDLTAAFADEAPAADTARLTKALRAAEAKAAEPWPQRVEAARRNAERAVAACHEHVREHYPELAAVLLPDAYAAHAGVLQAVAELNDALDAYQRAGQRVAWILAPSPLQAREHLPTYNVSGTLRHELASLEHLPVLFPSALVPASVH